MALAKKSQWVINYNMILDYKSHSKMLQWYNDYCYKTLWIFMSAYDCGYTVL